MIKILPTTETNSLDLKDMPTELHLPVVLATHDENGPQCQQRVVRYIREDVAELKVKEKIVKSYKGFRKHINAETLCAKYNLVKRFSIEDAYEYMVTTKLDEYIGLMKQGWQGKTCTNNIYILRRLKQQKKS